MKRTIEKILKEWKKMGPISKQSAQALSGRPRSELPIIGVWRRRRQKRLDKLATLCGRVRNLSLHYTVRPKRPYLYLFEEDKLKKLLDR